MKKLTLSIIFVLFLKLFIHSTGLPIIDTKRIASWVAKNILISEKWDKYLSVFEGGDGWIGMLKMDGCVSVNSFKGILGLKEWEIRALNPKEWVEEINIILNSEYFNNRNIWKDLYNSFNLKDKYPSLNNDFSKHHKNNLFYKENIEFKEFVDENKRVFKNEYIKNIENSVLVLSQYNEIEEEKETILKKIKEDINIAGSRDDIDVAGKQSKLFALSTLIDIIILEKNNEIITMLSLYKESLLKKEVWDLERKRRNIKLNAKSKKNVEKLMEMLK